MKKFIAIFFIVFVLSFFCGCDKHEKEGYIINGVEYKMMFYDVLTSKDLKESNYYYFSSNTGKVIIYKSYSSKKNSKNEVDIYFGNYKLDKSYNNEKKDDGTYIFYNLINQKGEKVPNQTGVLETKEYHSKRGSKKSGWHYIVPCFDSKNCKKSLKFDDKGIFEYIRNKYSHLIGNND